MKNSLHSGCMQQPSKQNKGLVINTPNILILNSGKGWVAVDKPWGMSIHNDPGIDLCSVMTSYVKDNPEFAAQTDFDPEFGLNPVHRLDKLTSGVVLLSSNAESFRFFSRQFETRSVEKRYIAIVHGQVKKQQGLWKWPLTKKPGGRTNPAGTGKKMPSQTRFKVLKLYERYSLVECSLLTGRKHQIRRHAKLAGHAIVGDSRYGTAASVNFFKTKLDFHRLGLHSAYLKINFPGKPEPVVIKSEKIPVEMENLLKI